MATPPARCMALTVLTPAVDHQSPTIPDLHHAQRDQSDMQHVHARTQVGRKVEQRPRHGLDNRQASVEVRGGDPAVRPINAGALRATVLDDINAVYMDHLVQEQRQHNLQRCEAWGEDVISSRSWHFRLGAT